MIDTPSLVKRRGKKVRHILKGLFTDFTWGGGGPQNQVNCTAQEYCLLFLIFSIPFATVDLMVSRIGSKWSDSNGVIGPFRDVFESILVATGIT